MFSRINTAFTVLRDRPKNTDMTWEIFHIKLRACDSARNIHRFYHINAGRDLLGDLVVTVRHGRIGTYGQSKSYVVTNAEEAAQLVRKSLNRRKTSTGRIGVCYEIQTQVDPDHWLGPEEQDPADPPETVV